MTVTELLRMKFTLAGQGCDLFNRTLHAVPSVGLQPYKKDMF